jgi:hypothetical protein
MPPRRGWGIGWRAFYKDFAPDGAFGWRATVSAGPVTVGGWEEAVENGGVAVRKHLRMDVATAALQPRPRTSAALPHNRSAVAAFCPVWVDAVGLRWVKVQNENNSEGVVATLQE